MIPKGQMCAYDISFLVNVSATIWKIVLYPICFYYKFSISIPCCEFSKTIHIAMWQNLLNKLWRPIIVLSYWLSLSLFFPDHIRRILSVIECYATHYENMQIQHFVNLWCFSSLFLCYIFYCASFYYRYLLIR